MLDETTDLFDVFLRHRPRSISRRSTAFHAKQQCVGVTSDLDEGNKRATDGTESRRAQTNSNPKIEPNPELRRAPPNSSRGLRNRRSQVRILSGALRVWLHEPSFGLDGALRRRAQRSESPSRSFGLSPVTSFSLILAACAGSRLGAERRKGSWPSLRTVGGGLRQ
jgi:hypothetical protein